MLALRCGFKVSYLLFYVVFYMFLFSDLVFSYYFLLICVLVWCLWFWLDVGLCTEWVCLGCGFASCIRRSVWFCLGLGFELCICLVCWVAYLILLCWFFVCCLGACLGLILWVDINLWLLWC